jgi:ribosome maturation factor RimP
VSSAQLAERLEPTVARAVRGCGLELEELVLTSAGRKSLLRVIVDSPGGDPLDLDAVAEVSRAVSAALDEEDRSGTSRLGAYTLEVSSRGLDRPLTLPRHWAHARLRLVKVRTTDGRELVGRVGEVGELGEVGGRVTLLVAGELVQLDLAAVQRAVVQVEFADPPAAEVAMLTGELRTGSNGSKKERP